MTTIQTTMCLLQPRALLRLLSTAKPLLSSPCPHNCINDTIDNRFASQCFEPTRRLNPSSALQHAPTHQRLCCTLRVWPDRASATDAVASHNGIDTRYTAVRSKAFNQTGKNTAPNFQTPCPSRRDNGESMRNLPHSCTAGNMLRSHPNMANSHASEIMLCMASWHQAFPPSAASSKPEKPLVLAPPPMPPSEVLS